MSSLDSRIAKDEKELVLITFFYPFLNKFQAYLTDESENLEKELKRVEGQINRYSREVKEAQDLVNSMERALPWLVQEYENFGKFLSFPCKIAD